MTALNLGIAGLGNVGCGLVELVNRQLELRLPGPVKIGGVTARSRSRNRAVSIDEFAWFDSAEAMASDPGIDVFVELMGGSDGPAKLSVEAALKAKKPVVTANKALIAEHGTELAALAEEQGVDLLFEAAVAGGVPVVRALRDSLSGISVSRVSGILNGTCNFLTTEMLATGRPYDEVLAEAQRLGYAEADPTLDVSGTDAAHKAAILSAIAFSADVDFSKVSISGVDGIELQDLTFASRLGLMVKLIAEGVRTASGVVCRVEPKALPLDHPIAQVHGSLNTVRIEGDPLGAVVMTGPGAGAGPTASAVMGDISKLFRPGVRSAFGRAEHHRKSTFVEPAGDERSPWFLSAALADRSGTLAALSDALASESVSIDKLLQDSAGEDGASPIGMVTHACRESEVAQAVKTLQNQETLVGKPRLIRIETGQM
ncbi:MAG: homoserine dehydrogenase [Pseudomonadota bacterium]